jgi:hypothetical protein
MTRRPPQRPARPQRERGGRGGARAGGAALARGVLLGVLLWIAPVTLVWLLATPLYNRVLGRTTETLVRLTEWPAATRLHPKGVHDLLVTRADYRGGQGFLYTIRVTDIQFNLILVGALFLAVPGEPWRRRLAALGWALAATVGFHLLLLFCWVKFVYATQLGEWSLARYGAWGRNFWGLAKHTLDLPLKFALPLALWAGFYLDRVLPPARSSSGAPGLH